MAYLVIAIGALMSLIGVSAIVSGFPIIEVERGWAEVISGSTLLAGGLVTGALGVVLQTLLAIRRSLSTREASVLAGRASEALRPAAPVPVSSGADPSLADPPTNFAGTSSVGVPSLPLDALTAERADHFHDVASAPLAADEARPVAAEHAEAQHDQVAFERLAPEHAPQDFGVQAQGSHEPALPETVFVEPAPHDAEFVAPVSHAAALSPVDGYELQTPSTPDHDLAPIPAAPGDWLDRAFSDLDEELSAGAQGVDRVPQASTLAKVHAEPRPAAPNARVAYLEPSGETIEAEAPAAAVAPGAPAAHPAMEADAAAVESPVIGRYESEGTSYVMYADGSIEAQSDAGIYRFQSMAELKAFIEG